MAYFIEQIKFIETSPYTYQLSFIYDKNALDTNNIDKTRTQEEVVSYLQNFLADFDARRAKSNYDTLKTNFEGKSVTI